MDTPKPNLKDVFNKSVFAEDKQQCLAVLPVIDLSKKKKDDRQVLLTLAVDNEGNPFYCVIRRSEKSSAVTYKIKYSEILRDVTHIDARQDSPVYLDFMHKSGKTVSFACDDPSEKHNFLICLYKAIYHFFKSSTEAPEIINFTVPDDLLVLKDVPFFQDNLTDTDHESRFQAITESEERQLYRLFEDWGFGICDSESLIEKCLAKLGDIDFASVNAIINAEEESIYLMRRLDEVIADVSQLEQIVVAFANRLDAISSAVQTMSAKDVLFEVENTNRDRLRRMLEVILSNVNVAPSDIALLERCQLSLPLQPQLVNAANQALHACQFQLPARLEHSIEGLRNRRADVIGVCKVFAKRSYSSIADHIIKQVQNESALFDSELTNLPLHTNLFKTLMNWAPLVDFIRRCDTVVFTQLTKVVKLSFAPLYNREITAFLKNARTAVSHDLISSSVKSMGSIVSVDTLFGKPDKSTKGSITNGADLFDINIANKPKRVRSSKVAEKVLVQLKDRLTDQQEFFINFYGMKDEKKLTQLILPEDDSIRELKEIEPYLFMDDVSVGENRAEEQSQTSVGSSSQYDFIASNDITLSSMMSDLFGDVDSEVQSLLMHVIKQDQLNCLYIFVILSDIASKIQFRNSFIQRMFASLLITVKRILDSFSKSIVDSILSFRTARNKRIDIISYVNFIEDFISEAEEVFENSSRRIDLDKIYKLIFDAIFQNLVVIAADSTKTPPDLILIENYHRLHHIMRTSKVAALETEQKHSEELYIASKKSFATSLVAHALDSLWYFFDSINQNLENGVKPDDIQYHNQFSIVSLKEILRKQTWTEICKRLDVIYSKTQRNIPEGSSLFQVIWHDVRTSFLSKIEQIDKIISVCYPNSNVALDFSVTDVAHYFTLVGDEELEIASL